MISDLRFANIMNNETFVKTLYVQHYEHLTRDTASCVSTFNF